MLVEFSPGLPAVESPPPFQATLPSFPSLLFAVYSLAFSKLRIKLDLSLAFGSTTESIRIWTKAQQLHGAFPWPFKSSPAACFCLEPCFYTKVLYGSFEMIKSKKEPRLWKKFASSHAIISVRHILNILQKKTAGSYKLQTYKKTYK